MATVMPVVPRAERPDIKLRRPKLTLCQATPRYWMDGNPVATHVMNALSCTFLGGEAFFVRSVVAHQAKIVDPVLKRDVRNFAGQESIHSQEHEELNRWVDSFGLPATKLSAAIDGHMRACSRLLSFLPVQQLAYTAAMEHLTAVIGHAILATPSFRDRMHPDVRPLWIWHSIEEIEHKAVAHEVLEVVGVGYAQRVTVMLLTLLGLFSGLAVGLAMLLLADKQLFNFKAFAGFFRMLVGTGIAMRVARGVLAYFRPGFHPWQVDDRMLLGEGLRLLEEAGSGFATWKTSTAAGHAAAAVPNFAPVAPLGK